MFFFCLQFSLPKKLWMWGRLKAAQLWEHGQRGKFECGSVSSFTANNEKRQNERKKREKMEKSIFLTKKERKEKLLKRITKAKRRKILILIKTKHIR